MKSTLQPLADARVSGFEVLRSLRVSKVKTPILILTGLAGIEDKVSSLGFGADDYGAKATGHRSPCPKTKTRPVHRIALEVAIARRKPS